MNAPASDLPRRSVREAIAGFEAWFAQNPLQAREARLVFDADGTLWTCDVGELLFEAALARRAIRDAALPALREVAANCSLDDSGTANELAMRLYAAYRERIVPERVGAEMLIWCYAGWTPREWQEFAERCFDGADFARLHHPPTRELLAWARRRQLAVLVVSASPFAAVAAAARTLGIGPDEIVAGEPDLVGGRFAPRLARALPWGPGKVSGGRARTGAATWMAACGDSAFDFAMMQEAQFGVAVRPRPELRACMRIAGGHPRHFELVAEAEVTVVIPAHDAAGTIEETLRSLQAQTEDRWRAIVVDDGSTDGTADRVQDMAGRDARISCLRQPAGGVSAARNRGIDAADTEWLLFLDADDWVAPDFLARMLGALRADPAADVVFCGSQRVLPDGAVLAELPGERMTFPAGLAEDAVRLLAESCPLAIHSVLVRRRSALDAGGFDPGIRTSEDWDFWLRVARTGARWIGVPEPLAFYRQRTVPAGEKLLRVVRDAQQVIAQARLPDARLRRADPRFEAGCDDADLAQRLAGVTLYFAGVAAGEGGDVRALFETLAHWPDLGEEQALQDAARDIEAGLAVGARLTHAELAGAWPRLWPFIDVVSSLVAQRAAHAGVRERFLRALEEIVLRAATLAAPCALHSATGIEVDVDSLPEMLEAPRTDRLYLRARFDEQTLEEIWIERPLALSRAELALLLVRRLGLESYVHAEPGGHFAAALARRFPPETSAQRLQRRVEQAGSLLATACRIPDAPNESDPQRGAAQAAHWRQAGMANVVRLVPADAANDAFEARAATSSHHVPVLMYHSVAADGHAALAQWRLHPRLLDEQLAWLRAQGYHSVSSRQVRDFLRGGRPLPGKPVVLTFDDGYEDFRTTAWPLLRKHGFTAEVFLVTDRVGGTADWDRAYGAPAPLMDWDAIAALHREGVIFGSHFATHRRCTLLTTGELVEEAARSRGAIEARLGSATSVAIPFGTWDERLVRALDWAGYEIGYTTADGVVAPGMRPLTLPRIEVFGGMSAEVLARRLGHEDLAA